MVTDLLVMASISREKEQENETFVDFLKTCDTIEVDEAVVKINAHVEPLINCTKCGNCCKNLMINVTAEETQKLSHALELTVEQIQVKFLEKGLGDSFIMKSMPCSFLSGTRCSIYENRFAGCREFPNLNKTEFTKRLFTTMMHYNRCPIIFNVIEELKIQTHFRDYFKTLKKQPETE
jgi:Fe-S-cluster containining protein